MDIDEVVFSEQQSKSEPAIETDVGCKFRQGVETAPFYNHKIIGASGVEPVYLFNEIAHECAIYGVFGRRVHIGNRKHSDGFGVG